MWEKVLDWFGFGPNDHASSHGQDHGHDGGHGHTHGVVDATIATTDRGIWAIKWSFVVMAITAVLQLLVVNRLIDPGSEFRLHRQWFDQSAMDVLLGVDFAVAEKDRLYRCLDRILEHK